MSDLVFTKGDAITTPPTGTSSIYAKSDGLFYTMDENGVETPLKGATGPTGATGATGAGVVAGGTTGQYLKKNSNTNYDTTWAGIQASDVPTLNQNTTGSAGSFTGSLSGDVTGTQSATVVATVGGSSASTVHSAEQAANAATSANTASTIVKRDGSGNVTVGEVYGAALDSPSAGGTISLGAINASTINIGSPGATVNIQGATTYISSTNTDVTDQLITLNHGGASGSGAGTGIEVEEAATITGYEKVSSDRNSWTFKAPNTAGIASLTPGASNDTVVLAAATQTLTNKTITGTFSGPLTGNVTGNASGTAANVTGTVAIGNGGTGQTSASAAFGALSPLSTKGDILVYGTANSRLPIGANGQVLLGDSSQTAGLRWATLQQGSKNYISNNNFEGNATTGWTLSHTTLSGTTPNQTSGSWTAAAGTLSFAATATSPLAGTYSGSLASSGATTAGDMLTSSAFTIDQEDQAKCLAFKFFYKLASGTGNFSGTSSNSFAVWIYDVTNAAWIQPAGVYNLVQSSGVGIATGTFQTPSNGSQFQLALVCINATSGAATLVVDDFSVGPQTTVSAPAMSDWQSYAMTITGTTTNPAKGTIATDQAYWRRVGDSIEISYAFKQTAAGSAGSGSYLFSLPPGLSIDSTKINISTDSNVSGALGTFEGYNGNNVFGYTYAYDTAHIAATINTSTTNPSQTGVGSGSISLGAAGTTEFAFRAKLPITGWSSNTVSSADFAGRVIALRASSTVATTISGTTTIPFATVTVDTAGAYSSPTYTVQVSGDYWVSAKFATAANNAGTAYIVQNGSVVSRNGAVNITGQTSYWVSDLLKCNAGDTIIIQADSAGTPALSTNAQQNSLVIQRLSDTSAVVQAQESVTARYTDTSGTALSGTAVKIPFATKDYDSHGWMSVGRYTVGVSGEFLFNVRFTATGSAVGTLYFYKNGSSFSRAGSANAQYNGFEQLKLVAGDYIEVWADSSGTPTLSTTAGQNVFTVARVGN